MANHRIWVVHSRGANAALAGMLITPGKKIALIEDPWVYPWVADQETDHERL